MVQRAGFGPPWNIPFPCLGVLFVERRPSDRHPEVRSREGPRCHAAATIRIKARSQRWRPRQANHVRSGRLPQPAFHGSGNRNPRMLAAFVPRLRNQPGLRRLQAGCIPGPHNRCMQRDRQSILGRLAPYPEHVPFPVSGERALLVRAGYVACPARVGWLWRRPRLFRALAHPPGMFCFIFIQGCFFPVVFLTCRHAVLLVFWPVS